jgi:hypothetical protein
VYKTLEVTSKHQPKRRLRIYARTAATLIVTTAYFIPKPTEVQYLVHLLKDVIVGYELPKTAGYEKVLLPPVLVTYHP